MGHGIWPCRAAGVEKFAVLRLRKAQPGQAALMGEIGVIHSSAMM